MNRKIVRIVQTKANQGFLGVGHTAIQVVEGSDFQQTDPFIVMMDDQLDLPGHGVVGGPHPHAGFEIATLVLEGSPESDFQTGSLEWLTTGSGIVHTEEIKTKVKLRILQLWLVLPKTKRWTAPKWQKLPFKNVPSKKTGRSEIYVYSGSAFGLTSPISSETPITIVLFKLDKNDKVTQQLPTNFNGFIYMLEGSIVAGGEATPIEKQQVAWLDRSTEEGDSKIDFIGGAEGGSFVLYAGEPQRVPIISYGPFVVDREEEIKPLFQDFKAGRIPHLKNLPESQVVYHG